MRAVCWHGTRDVRVEQVPDPEILNPRDAIVRVILTAICGSDLHLWNGLIPTMRAGDVLGHEFMGEVVEVGRGVHDLKVGDRVVVPFPIACGACFFCREGYTSLPPVPGAAPITWIEASALAMHLPDAAFDVVLCQQGVQFFQDRPAALHEMRRVLVPGGRVLISIWASSPTPYNVALWNAVERHIGPDAAATFRRAGWDRIPRRCGSSWHKQDSGTYRFVFALARPVYQQSPSSCCGTLRPAQWPTQSMRSPTAPGKPSPRRSVRRCGHMVTERELRSRKRPM